MGSHQRKQLLVRYTYWSIAILLLVESRATGTGASGDAAYTSAAVVPHDVEAKFQLWLSKLRMSFQGEERIRRLRIFHENLRFINAHNAKPNASYTLSVNKFAHLSFAEFESIYLRHARPGSRSPMGRRSLMDINPIRRQDTSRQWRWPRTLLLRGGERATEVARRRRLRVGRRGLVRFQRFWSMYKKLTAENGTGRMSTPDNVDWRTSGAVTSVKDQGACGEWSANLCTVIVVVDAAICAWLPSRGLNGLLCLAVHPSVSLCKLALPYAHRNSRHLSLSCLAYPSRSPFPVSSLDGWAMGGVVRVSASRLPSVSS